MSERRASFFAFQALGSILSLILWVFSFPATKKYSASPWELPSFSIYLLSSRPMPDFLSLSFLAVGLAGLVRGFAGFGSALIMTPILSAAFGPSEAVFLALTLECLLAIPFVPRAWPYVQWQEMARLCAAATLLMPLGAQLLLSIDPSVMRYALSAIVLLAIVILAGGFAYRGRAHWAMTLAAGGVSGFFNGLAGMAGPPIIFYYLSGPRKAAEMRASFIVYFAFVDIVALAILWWRGAAPDGLEIKLLWLGPVFLMTAGFGALLFRKEHENLYRKVAIGILILSAVISPWV